MTALSSGDLKKDYARFAAPTMLSMFVYAAYSMVDGVFVGHLVGAEALAAVNFGAPFLSVLFALAVLTGIGASTVIALLLGQRQEDKACETFTQGVVCAVAAGAAAGLAVRLFLTPVCRILGADDAVLDYTRQYVGTLALFAVPVLLEYNLEVLVKADGCPRLAAVTVASACTLHAVLDWLLIGRLGLGVRGAAMATGLAETVACIVFLSHFLFAKNHSLRFVRFRFEWRQLGRIVLLGIPEAMSDLCIGIVTWLYNRVVLRWLGTGGVAGYTVITYVNTLVLYTLAGASQGMQPLVSYHRGTGDMRAARTLRRYAMITATAAGAAFVLLLELIPGTVASIFIPAGQTELHGLAVYALRRYGLGYLASGFSLIAAGYMTACEKPIYALGITLGRGCLLPCAALTVLTALFAADGIWWAALTGELLMLLVSAMLLRRVKT